MELSLKTRLREVAFAYSSRARARRAHLFRSLFPLAASSTVLDLGGGTGAHIRAVLNGTAVRPQNVCIADVSERELAEASAAGHRTVCLNESGALPFEDQSFDVVFSSSVIEHVTGPKGDLWNQRDAGFSSRALGYQRAFADEIRRIGRGYWVQTPARSFPIESHLWMPFVHWLPRGRQVAICEWALKHWPKGAIPDFHLLTRRHMEALFPGAEILREQAFGLAKSWIAVRRV